jgi:hypothetical protein
MSLHSPDQTLLASCVVEYIRINIKKGAVLINRHLLQPIIIN